MKGHGSDYPNKPTDTSQYIGPPANNPMHRYMPVQGRFITAPTLLTTGKQVRIDEAKVGSTRVFVRMWDYDDGSIAPFSDRASWQRGSLVRGSQYVFVLTQLGPMYDPTSPNTWRAEL